MKLKIVKLGTEIGQKPLFTVNIPAKEADIWYKEVSRRFREMSQIDEEVKRMEYTMVFHVYDIDEAYECGIMSLGHFQDMIEFLYDEIEIGN